MKTNKYFVTIIVALMMVAGVPAKTDIGLSFIPATLFLSFSMTAFLV